MAEIRIGDLPNAGALPEVDLPVLPGGAQPEPSPEIKPLAITITPLPEDDHSDAYLETRREANAPSSTAWKAAAEAGMDPSQVMLDKPLYDAIETRTDGENTYTVGVDNSHPENTIIMQILDVAYDVGAGLIKGAVQGLQPAGNEMGDALTDGYWTTHIRPYLNENIPHLEDANKALDEVIKPDGKVQEVVASIASPLAQVVAPGALFTRAFRAAGYGRIVAETLGYSAGEVVAMAPEEVTLMELGLQLIDDDPEVQTVIEEAFAAQLSEDDFMARVKNMPRRALEGGGVGVVTERMFQAIGMAYRAIKGSPQFKKTIAEATQRFNEGKSPLPVGNSIEDVGDDAAARQLGATTAPVLVPKAEADALRKIAGVNQQIDEAKIIKEADADIKRLADVEGLDEKKRRTLSDLQHRIPIADRVAKPHTPGEKMEPIAGGRFLDQDLTARGTASIGEQADLDRIWNESVEESGGVAGRTVGRLNMAPREAAFWNTALNLPDRIRYWYEVSTESFVDRLPDLSDDELKRFIAVVSATSPVANPFQNLQRAVAAFSLHLRGLPIESDLVIPRSVRDALRSGDLEGLKTGSFGGTMQYIDGLTDLPPLSTNDRQVASSFGVKGDDIAGNPELYEVTSRFYTKLRDHLNASLPEGAEPYETWQLQALGWVQERTISGNPFGDDYLDALTKIDPGAGRDRKSVIQLLEEGGVSVPDGILTREILMDERVAGLLSPTMKPFQEAPIATIEVNSVKTLAGARAADLLEKAVAANDTVAITAYNKATTSALSKASRGTTSPFGPLVSAVKGKQTNVSRMSVPTSERPFDVAGTYQGAMSPNIRVPLSGFDSVEMEAVTAGIAKAWKQEGVPATQFGTVDPDAEVAEGAIRTFSLFVSTTDDVDGRHWLRFANALPDANEISINRTPNGYVLDIHPDYKNGIGPALDLVEEASQELGGLAENIRVMYRDVVPFSYATLDEADVAINVWKDRVQKNAVKELRKHAGIDAKSAREFLNGDAAPASDLTADQQKRSLRIRDQWRGRIGAFDEAVTKAQDLAGSLAEAQRAWAEKFGPRLGADKPVKPVKSTPAVERFIEQPQGRAPVAPVGGASP